MCIPLALLTSVNFLRVDQANKMYQNERDTIEAQYNDAREQIVQRFLYSLDERRRKLREEKEGGDVISGTLPLSSPLGLASLRMKTATDEQPTEALLENAMKPKVKRRKLFSHRTPSSSSRGTPSSGPSRGLTSVSPGEYAADGTKSNDLLLNGMLPLALATVGVDDILTPNSTSLAVAPPITAPVFPAAPGKRGPRGKAQQAQADAAAANGIDKDAISAAPGTLTALAIASGQQAPVQPKTSRGAGAQGQWVLGKSLADLSKMTSASQLEIESDWARIQGTTGRGRRNRAD